MEVQSFDFAIVGGGVYGLCTAYHLAKQGAEIAIFEQFTIGHGNGSSHGPTRIIRQAYMNQIYSQLTKKSMNQLSKLQTVLQSKLVYQNDYLAISDISDKILKFEDIVKKFPRTQKKPTLQQVKDKFPQFPTLPESLSIIQDTGAGIVAADLMVERLSQFLRSQDNVVIFQNTEVQEIEDNVNHVLLKLQSEHIRAKKIIVSAGKWVKDLVPEISQLLVSYIQNYFLIQLQNHEMYQVGRFPSFQIHSQEGVYYCLPDRIFQGVKFGLEVKSKQQNIDPQLIKKKIIQKIKQLFGNKFKKILNQQQCIYTMTKSQDFIIDWVNPKTQNILISSCCSGHGFKFAAYLGKVCSDLMMHNKSDELFEKIRYMFQIPYHQGVNLN